MRDPQRIDKIIDKIREIWKQNPDIRFWQLLFAIGYLESNEDPFMLEDDILEWCIDSFNNKE